MGEAEKDTHRQNGGEWAQFLYKELKGVAPENHLLAGRAKKQCNQIKQQTGPGKRRVCAWNQMPRTGQ